MTERDFGRAIYFDQLLRDLQNHTVKITFTKKDGTERLMRCTLQPQVVSLLVTGQGTSNPNPEVIPVWDLDKSAWRSFNRNSIIHYDTE
jgi:hypothetical protein